MHATRRITLGLSRGSAPGRRRDVATVVACVAACVALAGCSAAASTAPTAPVGSPSALPSAGVPLTALGATHAPAGFWLPAGIVPIEVIDQANVVALLFAPGGASTVVDHLVANAASMGFTVIRHNQTSVHLVAPGWDAAFTSSAEAAGLTLRKTKG